MISLVDTSVKFIHSSQVGSPTLNGTAGSLLSVLDALLVTGWGLQTATSLVVAGGVATISFGSTFPAIVDSVILVDGSSIAGAFHPVRIGGSGRGTGGRGARFRRRSTGCSCLRSHCRHHDEGLRRGDHGGKAERGGRRGTPPAGRQPPWPPPPAPAG